MSTYLLRVLFGMSAVLFYTGSVSALEYNGHHYALIGKCSWSDCEAKAEALGGHLAVVNDINEYFALKHAFSYLKKPVGSDYMRMKT